MTYDDGSKETFNDYCGNYEFNDNDTSDGLYEYKCSGKEKVVDSLSCSYMFGVGKGTCKDGACVMK